MRTVDRAGAQDDFSFGGGGAAIISDCVVNSNCAIAVEQDFQGQRSGYDRQIGPRPDGIEIAARCAPAPAGMGGSVVRSEAFLLRPIAIRSIGIACLSARLDKGIGQCSDSTVWGGHAQWAVFAVI